MTTRYREPDGAIPDRTARPEAAPARSAGPRSGLAWPYLVSDTIAALLAVLLATLVVTPGAGLDLIVLAAGLALPLSVALAGRYRRANVVLGERWFEDVLSLALAATVVAWIASLATFAFASAEESALGALAVWWVAVPVLAGIGRGLVHPRARSQPTVIVGSGDVAQTVAERLLAHPEYGVAPVGFLDDYPPPPDRPTGPVPLLGTTGDLERVIAARDIERVIISFSLLPEAAAADLVRRCADTGVSVDVVPRLFEILPLKPQVSVLEGTPLLTLPPRAGSRGKRVVKRTTDVLAAATGLLLTLPVLAVIALAVKLDDGGPILYRQTRVGRDGRIFQMLKLRSMAAEAPAPEPAEPGVIDKQPDDPRVTRVGRVLRRFSLDEVPQLLNVLRGDMSLVGPRPLPVQEAATVTGWRDARHEMRPGMTGLWQILGRSEIGFEERLRIDWIYVRYWSPAWDARILARTARAVIQGKGAF